MPAPRHLLPALLALLLAVSLSSCGATSTQVAHIEGAPDSSISRATLNHWMQAIVGGDFRLNIGTEGPRGLVSEPADYARCASAVKLVSPKTFFNQVKLKPSEIALKCRELHQALKAQALQFLISAQWADAEGREHGLEISDAELEREFARFRKQPYPTEADLRKYMAERHWVRSDILYQLKRNLLTSKLLPKLKAKAKQAGGGQQGYVKVALERQRGLIARTSCSPGYVVYSCKQYHGAPSGGAAASPDAILERMVQGTSG